MRLERLAESLGRAGWDHNAAAVREAIARIDELENRKIAALVPYFGAWYGFASLSAAQKSLEVDDDEIHRVDTWYWDGE